MNYHYVIHGDISVTLDNIGINALIAKMMCMGGKIGVNIFIIISVWFLIDVEFDKMLVYKKIKKIYLPVWFYSFGIYIFYVFILKNQFEIQDFIKAIFPITFSINWFATAYLLFVFFVPYLGILNRNITQRQHKDLCIILIIFFVLFPTLLGKYSISALNHPSNMVWFIALYFITSYIKKYGLELKNILGIIIIVVVYVFFFVTIYLIDYHNIKLCYKEVSSSIYFMQINSLPVFLCSYSIFLLFKNKKINCRGVNHIASLVFGVYLIHDNPYIRKWIWQEVCQSEVLFNKDLFLLYAFIGVSFIFIVCCFIEFIRKKIFLVLYKLKKEITL